MIIQLFVALVEAIRGSEKCNRIRNVNCHGNVELSASFPHGVKTRIVNFHQCARSDVFAKIKSQCLENLQAASTITMGALDRLCLQLRVIRLLEARIRRLGERIKAARIRTVVFRHGFGEPVLVATRQVDHGPNVLAVHYGEQFLRSSQIVAIRREFHSLFRLGRAGDVRMEVNVWKLRTLNAGLAHAEHASGLILRKLQRRGSACWLRLILSSPTRGPDPLRSICCREAHPIQPLTSTDHAQFLRLVSRL